MSEELLQRGLNKDNPTAKIGNWDYYNIGTTTLKALKNANIIRNIDYGNLENKKVDVEGWGDVIDAKRIIRECVDRFNAIENKPEGLFSIK